MLSQIFGIRGDDLMLPICRFLLGLALVLLGPGLLLFVIGKYFRRHVVKGHLRFVRFKFPSRAMAKKSPSVISLLGMVMGERGEWEYQDCTGAVRW